MITVKPNSALSIKMNDARVDSRELASILEVQHQNFFEQIKSLKEDLQALGLILFQTGLISGRGKPERYALLNEDQCYLLLTHTRNTAHVRPLKLALIQAFREVRLAAMQHQHEYLPAYHSLHCLIDELAIKSSNKQFVHMNMNKMVNQAVGLEAGQRANAGIPVISMVTTAQCVAAIALRGAIDHKDGYQKVKQAMGAFKQLTDGRSNLPGVGL